MRALDALRERPSLWSPPGGRATPVLFYGFDDLTPLQLDTIETLGRLVEAPVTVSLAYEAGRTAFAGRAATFQTLSPLAQEHRAMPPRADHYAEHARAALAHLERSLFELGARRVAPGAAVELLQGGGERAELELIAARVAALLREGWDPEEIAVVMRDPGRSAGLAAEVFGAAGIAIAMPVQRPLSDTSAGRALIGLLRCVPGPDGAAPGTPADLLAWLRAPGRLDAPGARGLARARRATARAENRRAGAGALGGGPVRARRDRPSLGGADARARGARGAGEPRAGAPVHGAAPWAGRGPRRGADGRGTGAGRWPQRARRTARPRACRRRRGTRIGGRAGGGARAARGQQRRAATARARAGARSAAAPRPPRAGAVPRRHAGGRVPAAREAPPPPRRGPAAACWPSAPGSCSGLSPTFSPPSAICSTRCCRARRSCSC